MARTSLYVLISFHSRDVFCTLSCLFVPPGLKCRNVLKHTERRSPLIVIKISKTTSPQRLRFSFTLKRNDINYPRKHSRNARVISVEELGTMPKNNLRGITLDIGPILGIHSLTLIISCLSVM